MQDHIVCLLQRLLVVQECFEIPSTKQIDHQITNFHIFCAISAIQLNITVPSEPYFVGFEVISNNSLKLKDLEETVVYIRLTVPFGCQRQSEECFLGVNIFIETGEDECLLPAAAALSSCGVKISSWRWNQSYPLRIAVKHGQNLHSISRTNNIRFRTDENFYHDFFCNYTLPKNIQVEVTTDASNLNGKECHAICDPHMQTFDGSKYENQNEGTYILYKHLKSPLQVQMRTNPCYGVPPDGPFCPCGVAIASGRDVFVVDRCSKPIKIYMPQCDDGTLKVKIKGAGNFYQIYLSTGTWVKITSGISFNIYIYPYISDRKSTSGLCGYLDADAQNDFVLRNGTTVPKEKFEDFNSHWLVKPEEDLFNSSNYKSLPSWPREDYLCMCGHYQDGYIVQPEHCSPDTRNSCPESVLNDSLAANCNINHRIKENVAIELDPSDFDVSQNENDTLTEIQTKRHFTKESANFECWSYLNRSLLFEKCSEIPDINPESFIEMCVMDTMLTNTTFWTPTHLDHAQKRCIHQVTVNQPIPEQIIKKYNVTSNSLEQVSNQTTNGTGIYSASLLQNLRDLACPMNCTGQGDCIKGQCRCYKGYGSEDCSVDMKKAPKVYGIPNRGVCDLQETRCDRISVLGEDFTNSQHLSCRLSIFQVKYDVQDNETRFHDYNSIVVQAQWISFAEVSCPIVDVRSKRSVQFSDDLDTLAIGYKVAVGNTRDIFGRDISLLVVDSLCVDCIKAGFNITCTLKHRYMDVYGKTDKLIVIQITLACKTKAQHKKDKKEKAYAELQEINKNNDDYGNMEEVYDEIADLPDDYASISDSVPTNNKLK
ncbi:hypothetical protein CHS0354_015039 [Potamilus streckersoni]|uniref:VWFD domain-containing protein n=1 Tax=Potamilus streckersoni TaxID=2493646 RepID=A0AAE0WC39_9BIVA|nr:hypothetical protein CHS0354_015039 [Potamilus streckersoni]